MKDFSFYLGWDVVIIEEYNSYLFIYEEESHVWY